MASLLPPDARLGFYRTAAGMKIDLVIEQGSHKIGGEIRFFVGAQAGEGFRQALWDLKLEAAYVGASALRGYPLAGGSEVIPVDEVSAHL